jgi:hypothetical protein
MPRLKWFSLLLAGSCLVACSKPASEPTESSVHRLTTKSIADRYIVVFKKGKTKNGVADRSVSDLAVSINSQYGGNIVHTYKRALQGAAMVLPPAAVESLRQDSRVAYVEPDRISHITASESNATWGIDRVDQRDLPLNQTYSYPDQAGEGVHAYVLDTGVYAGHSEFSGIGGGSRVIPGYDFIDNDGNPDDCHGHGTHVAGTIGGNTYGLAKKATLHSLRVLDCDGYGPNSGIIAAIDWVTANHVAPAVANMSLGGEYSQALNDAVTNSIAAGITYGIAAGNDSDDACYYSPASTPGAITVGASNSSDAKSDFSDYGSCLDVFAPGEDITSAWIGSATATRTISGTSMATPHVVGAAALWLGLHPTATPAEVVQLLTLRATPGIIASPGDSSPNLLLYMGNMVDPQTNPQLASMDVTPSIFESGTAASITLRLTDVAPAGGVIVALSSGDAAIVVPGTVLIPVGSQGTAVPLTASPVSDPTVVTFSATYNGVTVTSTATVLPSPTPARLTLSPYFVEGGATATATLTLTGPAPAGGAIVALSSSDTSVATVPAAITVPAGSTSAELTVTSLRQASSVYVTISAAYHGLTRSARLSVRGTPAVSWIVVDPSALEGGGTATARLGLAYSAPAGGAVVVLSSSDPAAQVPASVTIAQDGANAELPIATTTVSTQTSVTITATYPPGYSKSTVLSILPSPTVKSVSISPPTVWGGSSCNGTVTLSGPAPAGGAVVTLVSSNTSVAAVPSTLLVAAGSSSGTFPIVTVGQPTPLSVGISASLNGMTASDVVSVFSALPTGNAIYDPTLRAPKCGTPAASCDSGRLLDGRGQLGPESNAPNTIANSCSDGSDGTYHVESESLDRLAISTVDGSYLAPGKQVRIEADVYTFVFQGGEGGYPSDDRLDLYLTTNATANPLVWTLLTPTSILPPDGGPQILSYSFALPTTGTSNLWAIRGNYRWSGNQAVCQPRGFDDYDDLIFAVETTGPFNQAPMVNAGADQTVTLPASGALAGTATDDGLPDPPAALSSVWSKVSGPGMVTFANTSALATTATFSTAGSYTLRLTVSDGGLSSADDVVVTVNAGNSPCAGICSNPTSFTISGYYQSASLGTSARCYQTSSTIHGGRCGNFVSPRTLKVNGTAEVCNAGNWSSIPAKVGGGYCIQVSSGNYSSANFSVW